MRKTGDVASRIVFGLLCAALILSSAQTFAQSGPVGYWTLDEGSGTTPQDSSGNANHCTMSPAPSWVGLRIWKRRKGDHR